MGRMAIGAVLRLAASVYLVSFAYGEDPAARERRMGKWPQGKWSDLTNSHLWHNHDLAEHIQKQMGWRIPRQRHGHSATMWEYQKKMVLFGGASQGGQEVEPMND